MTTPQDATEALARALNRIGAQFDPGGMDLTPIVQADLAADGWSVVRTEDVERLRRVARAAEFLVGSIELGETRTLTLHAASQVNQALTALDYPANDEGLIDWAALGDPS